LHNVRLSSDLDFKELGRAAAVDYLHCGQALERLHELPATNRAMARTDLLARLGSASSSSSLRHLIEGYQPARKAINLGELKRGMTASLLWRQQFRALGSRGFSYELDTTMRGYDRAFVSSSKLDRRIDLRIALMPGRQLFYPPLVRACLEGVAWSENHYFRDGLPSIAFALGTRTPDDWFIFAMQSDLTSRGPACIREHFRGWRRVLFANVVAQAAGEASAVYLCRAEDIETARAGETQADCGSSTLLSKIYDQTARDWGMPLTRLRAPVDIQILRARHPVWADRFHGLVLASASSQRDADSEETPGIALRSSGTSVLSVRRESRGTSPLRSPLRACRSRGR
jgi:hypothetical protein